MICTLANSLWFAGCVSELARFRRATTRVAQEQQAVLDRIIRDNADTEFGRAHNFRAIRSVDEYRERIPIGDMTRHQPWIDRAAAGAPNILTRDPVRLFEPTSGSSGASKLIPYTATLQREFQRGIRAWIADVFGHFPALVAGPAYWSVSPVGAERGRTPGGIPIGFDNDAAYLGGWQRHLIDAVMAVPGSVRLASDMDAFRYATLLSLVRARNLRLISVWNPTFLSLIVERLPEWGDRIVRDLTAARANEVRAALRTNSLGEICARLWPKLGMISCWRDANAANPALHLAVLFPHSRMQGKGLIATEAFVSFPLVRHEGAALAIRSHFLEFLARDSDRPLLAHQLERDQEYDVVVTTGGGLYRYPLGDRIEVTGYLRDCPLIRFVGRQQVSDWFGEKLNDAHVSRVMQQVFRALHLSPSFAMLACDTHATPRYLLYIDSSEPDHELQHAADAIEQGLRENFHYDYARRLGQLASVRPFRVRHGAETYLKAAIRNGQKAGDVKVPALDRRNGWSKVFSEVIPDRCPDNVSRTSF